MTARRILANFFHLSLGELIARLVSFAAFAHLARALGSSDFGRLGFVMALGTYLLIPVLQGFDSVGIRDVARHPQLAARYAGNILAMRLLAALATWVLLGAAVFTLDLTPAMRWLLLLFGLTVFPSAASLKWAFQAAENNRPVALAGIVSQLIFAAGAFTVRGPEALLLVPVYAVAGDLAAAALLAAQFRRLYGSPRPAFETKLWRELFRESTPLTASTILGALLFNFDVLAIAWFQPASAVGLYTAVYKLITLLFAPLTLFQLSVFPSLSRAYASGADLRSAAAPVVRYLAAVFLPLPFAGLLMAGRTLEFLFGSEYLAGEAALQILLWSVPLMALRSFFRIILVSYNLQRLDLRTVLAGALTNVILDLILVPRLSILGAALATLASEAVILALSYYYLVNRVARVPLAAPCLRPLCAAGLMAAAAWRLSLAPFAAQAAAAAACYLAALFLLRGLEWREIAALYRG
jgi:O-antigen/teichoic acid export membrane protein